MPLFLLLYLALCYGIIRYCNGYNGGLGAGVNVLEMVKEFYAYSPSLLLCLYYMEVILWVGL